MPQCLSCGNNEVFESTSVQGVLYPAMGLVGHFDQDGTIKNMENRGASPETFTSAWKQPDIHFDSCPNCGSKNIIWP